MFRIFLILLFLPTLIYPTAFLNKKEASIYDDKNGLEFTLVTKKNNKNENIFRLNEVIEFTLNVKNTSSEEINLTQLTGGEFAAFIIYKEDTQIAYINANYGMIVTQSLLPLTLGAGESIISKESVTAKQILKEFGQYKVVVQSGLLLNNEMINIPLTTYFYVRK